MQRYTSHRGTLIHFGCLKTYETEIISQGELEQESLEYYHKYPQMKQEIDIAGKLFREFKQHFHLEPVRLEQVVWHTELGFAGRLDFGGYLVEKNGSSLTKIPILMDIKTSKRLYQTSLELQLAGYNLCIQKKARKLFCLLLHPGPSEVAGVRIGNSKPFWSFQEIIPNYQGFLSFLKVFKKLEPSKLAKIHEESKRN